MITVVLADDQPVVRQGFRAMLAADPAIDVVGEAADGAALVDLVADVRPAVALVDIRMPVLDGLAALERLAERDLLGAGRTRVIVLTTFDVDEYTDRALRAGASAFLLKTLSHEQLTEAVHLVAAGNAVLAPTATRRLIDRYLGQVPRPPDPAQLRRVAELTTREREVVGLVAAGRSNAEIAAALVISEHTVKTHMASVLAKTGCRDRTQVVVLAFDTGLAGYSTG